MSVSIEPFIANHDILVKTVTDIMVHKNARIGELEALYKHVSEVNKMLHHQLSIIEADNAQLRNQRDFEKIFHQMELDDMVPKLSEYQRLDIERREQVQDLVEQLLRTQHELEEVNKINEMRLRTNIDLNTRLKQAEKLTTILPEKEHRINVLTREVIIARATAEKALKNMESERNKHHIYIEEMERQHRIFIKQIESESCGMSQVDELKHTIEQLNAQHDDEKKRMYTNLQIASQIHAEKLADKDSQIAKLNETVAKFNTLFKQAVNKTQLSQSATN
jgi:hypothetical protein